MKRLFKILAYTLGVLALLVGIAVAFLYFRGIPTYEYAPTPEITALKVVPDSARVERGAKIATLLCNECHKNPSTGRLSGRIMSDLPAVFGEVASLNITQDPDHGIGSWTDGELYYFLRTGIRKDGSWAPPFMPKFPIMADEDLHSIIAWLRSNEQSLAADAREYPPNKFNLFTKFLANMAIFPPPLPERTITVPDPSDQVAFGKYVADALCACFACHSADFAKQDALHPEKSLGFYGGGNPMLNYEGELVPSANITMDKETGIGGWTLEEFREATKYGKNPKGGPLYYPMFPHTTLTDTEVDAIWAYLQTVPPIKNSVARYKPKG
ncbi:MAG: c-type cytochrome [Saprospiraceae bacterium]